MKRTPSYRKPSCFEKQRIFYRADLSSHPYHWGWYKQRRVRWVQGIDEYINTGIGYSYNEHCYQPGSIYGKSAFQHCLISCKDRIE